MPFSNIVMAEYPFTLCQMSSIFDEDEDVEEGVAPDSDELGELSLDELEDLQEDDVTGHRVVTTNDDGEDPFSSGTYYDE